MSSYSEQVRKDARAAAEYIREHGWIQGNLFDGKKCCAIGACWKGTDRWGDTEDQHFAKDFHLFKAMVDVIGNGGVARWNDTPGRTKEEVLAVFDKIANS
jgi:hypothetical protein